MRVSVGWCTCNLASPDLPTLILLLHSPGATACVSTRVSSVPFHKKTALSSVLCICCAISFLRITACFAWYALRVTILTQRAPSASLMDAGDCLRVTRLMKMQYLQYRANGNGSLPLLSPLEFAVAVTGPQVILA